MNNNSSYIIEKLTVDVNTSSVQQGYEIKDNVRSFIDQHVVPAIENYLMKLSKNVREDQMLQIDKLTLTVNSKQAQWNTSALQLAIQDEFDKAIKVAQSEIAKGLTPYGNQPVPEKTKATQSMDRPSLAAPEIENLTVIATSEHAILAWISFLQDGSTRWLSPEMLQDTTAVQESTLLEMILKSREKVFSNRTRIFESPVAFNRLTGQFSTGFLATLITILQRETVSISYRSVLSEKEQQAEAFLNALTFNLSSASKHRFWELVVRFLRLQTAQATLSDLQLLEAFTKLIPAKEMSRSISGIMTMVPVTGQSITEKESAAETEKSIAVQKDKELSKKAAAAGKELLKLNRNDASVGYIYLLEWLHQLQTVSKLVSYYAELQQQLLKEQKTASGEQMNTDAESPAFINKDTADFSVSEKEASITAAEKEWSGNETVSGQLDPTQNDLSETSKTKPDEIAASDQNKADLETETLSATNTTPEKEAVSETNSAPEKDAVQASATEQKATVTDASETSENKSIPADSSAADNATTDLLRAQKQKEAIASALKKSAGNQPHLLVENAGLVILHPFLKHFFTGIGILNESNKLTDPVLAAHVLHYIATGREQDFEQHMLFEKHLAGIDQQESIAREIVISDAIKQEVESLWNAVRANWAPMKTASAAAIRETFIQRPGKLIHESPNPRLVIEHKTVDILLGQLNWTISIIRLPWLDELIFVEW